MQEWAANRGDPMSREIFVRDSAAHLVVDLYLYPTAEGGRRSSIGLGFGCPCFASKELTDEAWDGFPKLTENGLQPGQRQRVEMVFMSGPRAAAALSKHGRFYLWDGRFIGEAEVVET